MKKIAIFNVGGALSSFAEIDGRYLIVDLGKSTDFSPVDNFLLPLAGKKQFKKYTEGDAAGKYYIDQLFLSHLDNDHISDYDKFRDYFQAGYMTCPNDNETQNNIFKIVLDFFTGENKIQKLVLSDMKIRRADIQNNYGMSIDNPLVSTFSDISLFYIRPDVCKSDELKSNYANNLSLVLFFAVNNKTVLMPGDISKEGMEFLINNNAMFKNKLNTLGIDFLIAPHHGLSTSFPEILFKEINSSKTRLNIISEKVRTEQDECLENRSDVDIRYYSSDYSTGDNSLKQNAVKTSRGHIVIDLETSDNEIRRYQNIEDVINEFI
jgi:beta-lactamase superfamily II metal-dependent hydrolase